jgi:hypothetical protein
VLFSAGAYAATFQAGAMVDVRRERGRSAYDNAAVARALREGLDPDGHALKRPMPRYDLPAQDEESLLAYLRQLTSAASPGTQGGVMRLAIVLAPDASIARQDAVLETVQAYAKEQSKNDMGWEIEAWRLQGAPESWRSQLNDYYSRAPVFALLSGAGSLHWDVITKFCNLQRIPCLLPSIDITLAADAQPYTFHFSAGLALEVDIVTAEFRTVAQSKGVQLWQWWEGDAGAAAARLLQIALPGVRGRALPDPVLWSDEVSRMAPGDTLVLWLRADTLTKLLQSDATGKLVGNKTLNILLSDTLLGADGLDLTSHLAPYLHKISAYDPLETRRTAMRVLPWLQRAGLPSTELRTRSEAYAACYVLGRALSERSRLQAQGLEVPLNRELLIDAIEHLGTLWRSDAVPLYPALSFGAGQHLGVRKAAIVPPIEQPAGATPTR